MSEQGHPNEKFTDKELEEALIEANGRPTKAATLLDVSYPTVYLRIRSNPKLKAVQSAYRARTHQDMADMAVRIAVYGLIKEPKIDDEGEIVYDDNGKVVMTEKKVDYGTRSNVILRLMDTYKFDDGVVEALNILTNGEDLSTEEWLQRRDELKRNQKEKENDNNAGSI